MPKEPVSQEMVGTLLTLFSHRKYDTIDLTLYGTAQEMRLEFDIDGLYVELDTYRGDLGEIIRVAGGEAFDRVPVDYLAYIVRCSLVCAERMEDLKEARIAKAIKAGLVDEERLAEGRVEVGEPALRVAARCLLSQMKGNRLKPEDLIERVSRLAEISDEAAADALFGLCKLPVERISLEALESREPKILLKGGPGLGKSTFCRHLVWRALTAQTGRILAAEENLPQGPAASLPLYVKLEGYVPVSDDPLHSLWAHCCAQWSELGLTVEGLERSFEQGEMWPVLDGLDEIRSRKSRRSLIEAVGRLTTNYPDGRVLVTSRPAAVDATMADRMGLTEHGILTLRDEQRALYLAKFMGAIYADDPDMARERSESLLAAIDENPFASDIARTPLILTVLATIHKGKGSHPTQSSRLYRACIDTLIWRRYRSVDPGEEGMEAAGRFTIKVAGSDSPTLLLEVEEVRELLSRIAWKVHTRKLGGGLTIPIVQGELDPYFEKFNIPEEVRYGSASEFLNLAELRLGILSRQERGWGFVHRIFQEYLAALRLSSMGDEAMMEEVTGRFHNKANREVIRLLFNILSEERRDVREVLMDRILAGLEKTPYSAAMIADCIESMREYGAVPPRSSEDTQHWLSAVLDMSALKAEVNSDAKELFLEAAGSLARTRDSERWDEETVPISGGTFFMGAKGRGDQSDRADEAPVHDVMLSAYNIDRYPVTVRQYKEFMDAGGYENQSLWTQDGQWWLEKNKADQPDEWKQQLKKLFNPVVGLSWYEASAFAAWKGKRLPTEAEWERAAKGNMDSRRYPWGGEEPSPLRGNYGRVFEMTTPVGSFPDGASPYNCMDMAGNVWEWCEDWYNSEYYKGSPPLNPMGPISGEMKVVRGGSWSYLPWALRVSYRYGHYPDIRLYSIGFRCASDFEVERAWVDDD